MPLIRKQSGFTLLEVLVAIVVLSLGLLGLAGLQAASLRNNQTAYYRGIATQQAYDMADRLRANLAGVRAGDYNALSGASADPACFFTAVGCTPVQMANTDYFQWNAVNAALLPGGAGTVTCESGVPGLTCTAAAAGNRVFNITISWNEKTEAGSVTQSFVTRVWP
jgi:type IV pilus assembly protein PilV